MGMIPLQSHQDRLCQVAHGKGKTICCPRSLRGGSMSDWPEVVFTEPSMMSGLNLYLFNAPF